jgi:phytoene synthase
MNPVRKTQWLGRPFPRIEAGLKVAGGIRYLDDMDFGPDLVYAAIVHSTCPHARLVQVDPAPAQALEGVLAVLTGRDVSGRLGHALADRPILAHERVRYVGEPVAVVAAATPELAAAAARRVEVIYAAVRYPDEVVDSFPFPPEERKALLDRWRGDFEHALAMDSLEQMLRSGISPFVAAFTVLTRETGIPPDEYRAFLDAMGRDIRPAPFATLEDLIEHYVYGSAVVVGLFLARVYGPSAPDRMDDALQSARDLGIALQLTNFLRDVREDWRRGRIYIPLDILREEGVDIARLDDPAQEEPLLRAVRRLAGTADVHYQRAEESLDAFSPDCRIAIEACIRVYGALNRRIKQSPDSLKVRQSVPFAEKWRVLPPSKYWRLPLALLER